jgi:uncharacterized protein (DUF111 family)
MKIERLLKKVSSFVTQLAIALMKAVLTSVIVGVVLVTAMHYMGVPVPTATELLRGVSRLANVLS